MQQLTLQNRSLRPEFFLLSFLLLCSHLMLKAFVLQGGKCLGDPNYDGSVKKTLGKSPMKNSSATPTILPFRLLPFSFSLIVLVSRLRF